ncbi:MAG: glycoside hydrolase family 1 protein [Candidatus Omnitrophica bacterium]|nr:glycoside hydrolase family 1 protein [Candidatus Omnitrophota bacterium]
MVKFPQNFLWGAATSSYQVEGNNTNSDWWQWEKDAGKENSGQACRHYELFNQDFDLAKSLNHNAHRLSIEWSRIEPEEGKFSEEELKHYVQVILSLRERNIEPLVTLHHFTNPIWFSKLGGWENKASVDYFLRYCDFVVRSLAKHLHFWITINEPTIYLSHSYLFGVWPPQVKSYLRAKKVSDNLVSAHIRAYRLINEIYKELNLEKPSIGIAQHMQAYVPCTQSFKDKFAAKLRNKLYNFSILNKISRHKAMDFIGLNYYSRQLVELKKWGIGNLVWDACQNNHHPLKKNSLGWDIYPEGIFDLLLMLKKYNLPVTITENGICTLDDSQRWEFIYAHLKNVHQAIEKGVNVAGYLYWSLMDNFEWDKGFGPRFGLIEIDYSTYKRTVRESALKFSQVCKTGILE